MKEIGTVKFVQIQQSPMKIGEGVARHYRPDPLLVVEKLLLTVEGIMGITGKGEHIMDVHHEHHAQSRFRGDNKISLGFTQHYAALREKFGDHMWDGVAAENIFIESDLEPNEALLGKKLVIVHQEDGNEIEMRHIFAAPPCREFSQFCQQRDLTPAELKSTLQFLDGGRRGFYAELIENDCQCLVQAGDKLYSV